MKKLPCWGPGEPVVSYGEPLSVELGPGLIETMFDGIQRPLEKLREATGDFIARGASAPSLDRERLWAFEPRAQVGDKVSSGDILGVVQENIIIEHRIMVPPDVEGEVVDIKAGDFRVTDIVATLRTPEGETKELTMLQKWPVRVRRPVKQKLNPNQPMVTGQRVIDTLFPLQREARLRTRPLSAAARRLCSTSWPSGPMWTLWCTWAAASAATR
jgi:V/A-type H+-transporting ATPase subunit A